jgi:DNA-binding NarL/FixJ family response regulator
MAQAMRNKEIAAALGVSEQTAQVHVKNIFAKLSVADRVAAINAARHHGLIRVL